MPNDGTSGLPLLTLIAMFSPSFPTGGFAYSHGLERACAEGRVADRADLEAWISDLLKHGSGWNDAVLFAEAYRRALAGGDLTELAGLAEALSGSLERWQESTHQGGAFIAAARGGWSTEILDALPDPSPYCVAVGAFSGSQGVAIADALGAYLQAFASALVQAAIRLAVTGQQGGVTTVASLQQVILAVAKRAVGSTLNDLGSGTVMSDLMAMRHEIQYSRLFRS